MYATYAYSNSPMTFLFLLMLPFGSSIFSAITNWKQARCFNGKDLECVLSFLFPNIMRIYFGLSRNKTYIGSSSNHEKLAVILSSVVT